MVRQLTCKHNLAFFIFQPSPLYFWLFPCRAVATNEKQANYYAAPNQKTIHQYVVPLLWHIPARHRIEMALRHLGCHMEIIMKFSEALPCVKSPVSRTLGPIYVVMCVENVLVRTPWKETWLELEKAGVETTKGWKVSRESDGKRVGRVMESE